VLARTLWKLQLLEFPNRGDMKSLLSSAGEATPHFGAWLTLSSSSTWMVYYQLGRSSSLRCGAHRLHVARVVLSPATA
jgi:hypothetical protein